MQHVQSILFSLVIATAAICMPAIAASQGEARQAQPQEIIVFMRHGEKPEAGLGQLNCKGLNRSLALPAVLSTLFGRPDLILAPDPSKRKEDGDRDYDYIRPLATIEPTAIAQGLPVDTSIGFDAVDDLERLLSKPSASQRLIFVAWEHKQIVKLVRSIVKHGGGDPHTVPKWAGTDFDSLYVLKRYADGRVLFEQAREGLDGRPDTCPGQAG